MMMKLNTIVFLFSILCCFWNKAENGYDIALSELEAPSFFYSGVDKTTTQAECANICSNFFDVEKNLFPIVTLEGFCFCSSKQEIIDKKTGLEPPKKSFVVENCDDPSTSGCLLNDGISDDPYETVKDFSMELSENAVVPTEANISLKLLKGQVTSSLSYAVKMSTKSEIIKVIGDNTASLHLMHPGYVKTFVTEDAISNMTKTFLNYFLSNITNGYFDIPHAIEDGEDRDFIFKLGSGTNVSLKITNPLSATGINFYSDVNMIANGEKSYLIKFASKQTTITQANNRLHILKKTSLHENGLLSFLEVNVEETGNLLLSVVRPQCPSGQTYSVSKQICGETDKLDGMKLINKIPISGNFHADLKIIYTILMTLDKKGHQMIYMADKHVEMKRGDMIAMRYQSSDAKLFASDGDTAQPYSYIESNFIPNTIASAKIENAILPSVRAYFTKFLNYHLLGSTKNKVSLKFIADITNPVSSQKIEKVVAIEKVLTFVKFIEGQPRNKSVGFYDTTIIDDSFIYFNATYGDIENVRLYFFIPAINKTLTTKPTHRYTTFQISQLGTGTFTVYAIASNLVSQVNTSIEISVLSRIKDVDMKTSKKMVHIDESFNVSVFIASGTDVQMIVDFGDGERVESKVYETAKGGLFFNTTHSYSKCNYYSMTATVNNKATAKELKETIKITTLCPLKGLTVTTQPVLSSRNDIIVSASESLELRIELESGSFVEFDIIWGDNETSNIKTSTLRPSTIFRSHQFEPGNYTVEIIAKAYGKDIRKTISVTSKKCAPPPISFAYGTKEVPLNVTRERNQDFVAQWEYKDPYCVTQIEPKFIAESWTITYPDNHTKVEAAIKVGRSVTFTVKPREMPLGSYIAILKMSYNRIDTTYTSYFTIIVTPPVAITNIGSSIDIARYQLVDGNATMYNFDFIGSKSYDPEMSREKMEYKWSCAVVTNETYVKKMTQNLTNPPNFCLEKTLTPLNESVGGSKPILSIFTINFIEGVSYRFQLDVSIGSRKGSTNGIVTVVPGTPPPIDVSCEENCNEKINTLEQIKYRFNCNTTTSCPKNLILQGYWTVTTNINGEEKQLDSSKFYTFLNSTNLALKAQSLVPDTEVTFKLRAFYLSQPNSVTKLSITRRTAGLPFGGYCKGWPEIGYSGDPVFNIRCEQWKTKEGSIRYQFLYDKFEKPAIEISTTNGKSLKSIPNAKEFTSFLKNFTLPSGLEEYNFTVGIVVYIQNKYDSYTEFNKINFTVYPPGFNQSNENSEEARETFLNSEPSNPDDINSVVSFAENQAAGMQYFTLSLEDTYQPKINKLTNLPDENDVKMQEEMKAKNDEAFRNATDKAVSLLANVVEKSMNSLRELEEAAGAMGSLSSNRDLLTEQATDTLIEATGTIVEKFATLSKGKGSEEKQQKAKKIYEVLSNLLIKLDSKNEDLKNQAANLQNEIPTESPTSQAPTKSSSSTMTPTEIFKKEANSSNTKNKKIVHSVKALNKELSEIKVPGENATILSTKAFGLLVQKSSPLALNNSKIGTDEKNSFKLQTDMSNVVDNPNEPVSIQSVTYDKSPYTDINSGSLTTKVGALNLKNDQGDEIEVKNLSVPILITIQNDRKKMLPTKISLYKPYEYIKKKFKITDGCNLLLDIRSMNDVENETTLFVYMQYGRQPGPNDYDAKLIISNKNATEIIVNDIPAQVVYQNSTINVTRSVYISNTSDGSIVMWNFDEFTLAPYLNTSLQKVLHFTFMYAGKVHKQQFFGNPYTYDELEMRGAFNYSFMAFCSSCSYWSEKYEMWMSDGVEVLVEHTNLDQTCCGATHLTAFGGFYVAPNPLPPLSFALLKEGYVLLVTVGVILLFWIIGVVILRRIDKADVTKIGVCPLMDNKTEDTFLYEITVNTGSRRYAGTQSNVCIIVAGDEGNTGIRQLKDNQRQTFQRASADVFIMTTAKSLGDLNYIRVWHDNSAGGWYLRSIEIIDLQTEEKYLFIASRWLSVDKYDGMVDCLLPVATDKELTDFNYLFTTKTRRDFSDAHIWYSIYARPPRSSFTRTQRLSVAISLLFCSMMASVMYFDAIPPGNAADENRLGSFKFTWRQVYVAIISACITVPVNLLLVGLFRSIKPDLAKTTSKGESDSSLTESNDGSNSQASSIQKPFINQEAPKELLEVDIKDQGNDKKKKKKPFYLPRWFLIPTWFLCIATILGCGFMVVWYGMAFGNKKSLDWLASVSICLVQDIIVMQPFKVFAMALFIALVVRKLDEEEKSEVEKQARHLAKDEAWLHQVVDETTVFDRIDTEDLQPPDLSKLDWMREIRMKELKMYAITRELLLYLLFTAVVFLIGYLSRDQSAYLQTRDIEELLSLQTRKKTKLSDEQQFQKILSQADFWPWMENLFLDEVFPAAWYNLSDAYSDTPDVRDFPGKIFLNDLNSKIVNGIRIRQVRVKPGSCDMADEVAEFMTQDCASDYNVVEEDTRTFKENWTKPYTDDETKPVLTPLSKPWSYQSWKDLDGYPFWAELNTYFGGGYVVEVFPRWENKAILESLKQMKWVDRYTRAVIIEFTLYNAATNYFNSMTIVAEFPPGGGAIPYYQCTTFQLYRYAKHNMIFAIACEVLFMILMIIFSIREIRLLYRTGWAYFKEFWNLVEISNIILTITAIVFYAYREILGRSLLGRLPSKKPDKFINFQFAAMWDMFFTYVIALICFFVTLKFIKLLRFNRRISLLSYTLKKAWFPLSMFGICFGIVVIAVVFSSSIIFGTNLYGYRDYQKTVASIISLLLGKFSYYQFENTNRVLGPIFFFAFNIMVNWIIMNMMISILTDVFAEVQAEVLAQSNDYEIVDFIIGHFKDWFGLGHSKKQAEREWQERSFLEDRKSRMEKESLSRLSKRSLKLRHLSNQEDIFGFARSSHWRDTNEESELLKLNDLSEDELNDTVDKFVKCFNVLYFDDQLVADQMNNVVKTEMKNSMKNSSVL